MSDIQRGGHSRGEAIGSRAKVVVLIAFTGSGACIPNYEHGFSRGEQKYLPACAFSCSIFLWSGTGRRHGAKIYSRRSNIHSKS